MQDDSFEWDDVKAASNLAKHGVTFEAARQAFDDPLALEEPDDEPDEERWRLIGSTEGVVHFVVYTERGSRRRIISARRATTAERQRYSNGE